MFSKNTSGPLQDRSFAEADVEAGMVVCDAPKLDILPTKRARLTVDMFFEICAEEVEEDECLGTATVVLSLGVKWTAALVGKGPEKTPVVWEQDT